jgi:hypothetical protein
MGRESNARRVRRCEIPNGDLIRLAALATVPQSLNLRWDDFVKSVELKWNMRGRAIVNVSNSTGNPCVRVPKKWMVHECAVV